MNVNIFADILSQIQDVKIRNFTVKCLEDAPSELETIPASTSGKYHHEDSHGTGGLVRHIQRAVYVMRTLCKAVGFDKDVQYQDILLSAILLHDIGKKGNYAKGKDGYFEYVNHPITAMRMCEKHKDMLDSKVYSRISNCIHHHMGIFSPKSIQKPITNFNILELMTYFSDYISAMPDYDIRPEKRLK